MRQDRWNDDWGFLPVNRESEQQCFECGELTTGRHHVVPVVYGGTKVIPLCQHCHRLAHRIGLGQLSSAGQEKARAAGVRFGAPTKLTCELARNIRALHATGLSCQKIAKQVGLSVGTVHKAIKQGRAPQPERADQP